MLKPNWIFHFFLQNRNKLPIITSADCMLGQLTWILVTRHEEPSWWDKLQEKGERAPREAGIVRPGVRKEGKLGRNLLGMWNLFWEKLGRQGILEPKPNRQQSPVSPINRSSNDFGKSSLGNAGVVLQLAAVRDSRDEGSYCFTEKLERTCTWKCYQTLQFWIKIRFYGDIHCLEAELTLQHIL